MSFILDALKKSETDRQRQTAPALFEVKVAAPRRRFPYWIVGLGALLVINAGVLAWILMRDPPAAAPATTAGNAAPPVTSPTVAATAEQQGMVTVTIPPTTVRIPMNSAVTTTPEPGVVGPSQAPPLAEEPMSIGPQLSDTGPSIPPDYDVRDYEPAITPSQAGALAERNAGLPSRDQLIAQGTALPDLRLDLHVYADDPAQRFVFINMRKLREGESLSEGVRVEQITPTGARLSYRGTRFNLARE
jgi:general secretion pathway protein B